MGMPRPDMVEDQRLRLGNARRGGLVAREVIPLKSRSARFRQAFGRKLQAEQALLLLPAPSVHSFGARCPLRILFLSAEMKVMQDAHLQPWRALPSPDGAAMALILNAANRSRAEVGDVLEWLHGQPRLPERADWLEQE